MCSSVLAPSRLPLNRTRDEEETGGYLELVIQLSKCTPPPAQHKSRGCNSSAPSAGLFRSYPVGKATSQSGSNNLKSAALGCAPSSHQYPLNGSKIQHQVLHIKKKHPKTLVLKNLAKKKHLFCLCFSLKHHF